MTTAAVILWGRRIGAVTWDAARELGFFEYEPAFVTSHIEVAPLRMPLSRQVYSFPRLPRVGFHGLPGMLADSLPDRFGNALIDAWLASQGRDSQDFNPVERLCYTGTRGMGALEFEPALGDHPTQANPVDLSLLVDLANRVLADRAAFSTVLQEGGDGADAVRQILRVGTSAGGARAKALISWNRATGEIRSGQVDHDPAFEPWLLKFDGVRGNRDHELDDPQGYGRIEYGYHLMARAAGIDMNECQLIEEHARAHFATRRFDRDAAGRKLHMQSLCALQHLDFNLPGAHSYEQAIVTARALELPMVAIEELVRRALFNIAARNQDDHTKNIAFLMDKQGRWSLAPAFDVTYAWNPAGAWTSQHQMSLAGKRDGFTRADIDAFGRSASLKRGRARTILDAVLGAIERWPEFAAQAGVPPEVAARIAVAHRVAGLRA